MGPMLTGWDWGCGSGSDAPTDILPSPPSPLQNSFVTGVYPASPASWVFVAGTILLAQFWRLDPSMGLIGKIQEHLPGRYLAHRDLGRSRHGGMEGRVWEGLSVSLGALVCRGHGTGEDGSFCSGEVVSFCSSQCAG